MPSDIATYRFCPGCSSLFKGTGLQCRSCRLKRGMLRLVVALGIVTVIGGAWIKLQPRIATGTEDAVVTDPDDEAAAATEQRVDREQPSSFWLYYDTRDPLIADVTRHARLVGRAGLPPPAPAPALAATPMPAPNAAQANAAPPALPPASPPAAGLAAPKTGAATPRSAAAKRPKPAKLGPSPTIDLAASARYGTHATISLPPRKKLCAAAGCALFIAFDNAPSEEFAFSDISDEHTPILLVTDYARLLNRLRSAQSILVLLLTDRDAVSTPATPDTPGDQIAAAARFSSTAFAAEKLVPPKV